MGILNNLFGGSNQAPQQHTQEEQGQFMDGFREGFPLVGQPANPEHETEEYQRGLNYGKKAFRRAGRPQINYDGPGAEE